MASQEEMKEVIIKEIINMLEQDFVQLQKLIDEIMKKKLDRKKVAEAYFITQKIDMELYRLVLTMWANLTHFLFTSSRKQLF